MHQTVGYFLRTLLHGEPPIDVTRAKDFIDKALSIAMHAMRTGVHTTLGSSPGSLDGTLTIELKPGISERINIRKIIPYKE